jgi:hypothetical protein
VGKTLGHFRAILGEDYELYWPALARIINAIIKAIVLSSLALSRKAGFIKCVHTSSVKLKS